jgi:transposase InsO family protein
MRALSSGTGHPMIGHHAGLVIRNRGIGWDYPQSPFDDASRLTYTELLEDEREHGATAFLARALAWFTRRGVTVVCVMIDNGSAYRSRHFADAVATVGLRHIRTRPYMPRTNGKAERFIQSRLREWTYARPFRSFAEPAPLCCLGSIIAGLTYLGGKRPISRIARDDLLGHDS